MKHPISNARATLKLRGLELPGWDTSIGLNVNRFWTELLNRERRQTASAATLASVLSLAAGSNAKVEDKLQGLQPFLDDYLSKTDHTAYTLGHQADKIVGQLREVLQKKAEFERLKWITSKDFSLEDWLNGK